MMDEESIFKSLTVKNDGNLKTLDDLSYYGKVFFYSCVHLMIKKNEISPLKQNTLDTFKILSENSILKVKRHEVLNILSTFIDNKGFLINNKKKRLISKINEHIESNLENKRPRKDKEEWLSTYKIQCEKGKHTSNEISKILGMKDVTLRQKISRFKKEHGEIEITYIGMENCKFCL